jgi:hypothetical protein
MKYYAVLNPPVTALVVAVVMVVVGLVVVAWYWFLTPGESLEILGQPALLKRGDYYEAYISVRNGGRDAVAVYGLEVEGGRCSVETGNNIKSGESLIIEARCNLNPDPGTSVVRGVLLTSQGSYPVVLALV